MSSENELLVRSWLNENPERGVVMPVDVEPTNNRMPSTGGMSRDQLEARRRRAVAAIARGDSDAKIANDFGVSRLTGWRWRMHYVVGGEECMVRRRKATGRPPRLTAEQLEVLAVVLKNTPRRDRTNHRLAMVIAKLFNVHYNPDHVRRLSKRLLT